MIRTVDVHPSSKIGLRDANEDKELNILNLSTNGQPTDSRMGPIDLCVVCDGHGGKEVADFVVGQFRSLLMKKELSYPLSNNYINKMFSAIQQKLIAHPNKIAKQCGCTALVVVRYANSHGQEYLQVINLGDCRAVLSRAGSAIPLSKDHKPFWPEEKKRIDQVNAKYNTNSRVHYDAGDWRIGDLSVSRSFGDLDNTPYVTHIPESQIHKLDSSDEFLVIACDGLWDVLQNHEAINFVRDFDTNNNIQYYVIPRKFNPHDVRANSIDKHGTANIASILGTYAIQRGSTDNVSVLIMFFRK